MMPMLNPFAPMFWLAFCNPIMYSTLYTHASMRHAAWGMPRDQHEMMMLGVFGASMPMPQYQPQQNYNGYFEAMLDMIRLMFVIEMERQYAYNREASRQVLQGRPQQRQRGLPASEAISPSHPDYPRMVQWPDPGPR